MPNDTEALDAILERVRDSARALSKVAITVSLWIADYLDRLIADPDRQIGGDDSLLEADIAGALRAPPAATTWPLRARQTPHARSARRQPGASRIIVISTPYTFSLNRFRYRGARLSRVPVLDSSRKS